MRRFTMHKSNKQLDYAIVIDNETGDEVYSGTVKECKDYVSKMS